MKPENHAIRQLEKQLDGATPEVAAQIERVVASLNAILLNAGDADAVAMCRKHLQTEINELEKLLPVPPIDPA